jgi:tryptophan 2,3-dioxygenase
MSYGKPPILNGSGKSDYENYLRTDELLSLQKGSDQWTHRDELLFTVVHQTSELWLKLAAAEVNESVQHLKSGDLDETQRLLRRTIICIHQLHESLDMLEQLTPWDYQKVRRALGHGSGFDSPGFNQLRISIPYLSEAFFSHLDKLGIDLISIFLGHAEFLNEFKLAEILLDIDAKLRLWRFRHYQVIVRTIGEEAIGTQGTPVEVLARLTNFQFFPELWSIRSELTFLAEGQNSP